MQIGRRNTIIAFVLLGAFSVGLAVALNITWAFHWRSVAAIVLGMILFGFIILAVSLNTIFLVREIRRSEQHDSFINAVTHELKTPIASVRLYLETLQSRPVEEEQRREFYRIMLEDTDRLLATVEQVLHAGRSGAIAPPAPSAARGFGFAAFRVRGTGAQAASPGGRADAHR